VGTQAAKGVKCKYQNACLPVGRQAKLWYPAVGGMIYYREAIP